jgi:hypothetical protein
MMNENLALCSATSWSLLGPGSSHSGLFQFSPMPEVSCPVLDIQACDPDLVFSACRRYHPSPELEVDIDGLIPALLQAGARLITFSNHAKACTTDLDSLSKQLDLGTYQGLLSVLEGEQP